MKDNISYFYNALLEY